jgi:hypothetical protein
MAYTRPERTSVTGRTADDVYANKGNIVRDDVYPEPSAAPLVAQGFDRTVADTAKVTLDDPPSTAVFIGGVAQSGGVVDTGNLTAGAYAFEYRIKSQGTAASGDYIAVVHRNADDDGDIAVLGQVEIGREGGGWGRFTAAAGESLVVFARGGTITGVEVDLVVTRL